MSELATSIFPTLLKADRRRSFAGTIYSVLLLSTLIPATFALIAGAGWSSLVKLVAITIAIGLAVAVLQSAVSRNFSLAWTVFWAWSYVFLGLAQLYQLASNSFPWKGQYSGTEVLTAQLVTALGCIVLYLTVTLTTRRKLALAYATLGADERKPNHRAVRTMLSATTVAYVAICAAFIAITGPSLFQGKLIFQTQLVANSVIPGAGSLFFISTAGAVVIPAAAIVARRNGVGLPTWLLTVTTLSAVIVTNPLTGSRFLTGSVLVAVIGALLIGKPILRLMPAGVCAVLVTVFPSLDLMRGDGTGSSALQFASPQNSLLSFDFDAFEMLLREVRVGGQIPQGMPGLFELFIAPFLRWVPLLSDSVQNDVTGRVVGELTGMGYTNVAMPLWGEAHLIGGFAGVILAFAALGVLLGTIRQPNVLPSLTRCAPTNMIIDASTAALLFIVLRGSLYEVLGYLLFPITVAVGVWLAQCSPGRNTRATTAKPHPAGHSQGRPRTVAFYLPQFHAIPENDEWWGKGFTEWVNVRRAQSQFSGHNHPRVPSELGHYDLSDGMPIHSQAALAKQYDVDAFCFYFYWFGGKRLLEKPLDAFLQSGPDFPFCISWANESWTRRWDGKDKESLIAQEYSPTAAIEVFDAFLPYLKDPRYLRLNGAAVLLIHRADHLPAGASYADTWRRRAQETGVGDLYIVAAETKPGISPESFDFDAVCEFPPVGSNTLGAAKLLPVRGLSRTFRGRLMSYPRLVRSFTSRQPPSFVRHRGVAPSWDNTARRQESSTVYVDASPHSYRGWLRHARSFEGGVRGSNGLVFVNAWNEWAEGAYLEPDEAHGRAYLEATRYEHSVELSRPPASSVGLPSIPWARSLLLATAGSALQWIRRARRTIRP